MMVARSVLFNIKHSFTIRSLMSQCTISIILLKSAEPMRKGSAFSGRISQSAAAENNFYITKGVADIPVIARHDNRLSFQHAAYDRFRFAGAEGYVKAEAFFSDGGD